MACVAGVEWRELSNSDRELLDDLVRRCHRVDGGLPLELCLPMTVSRFDGGQTVAAFAGPDLIAAAAINGNHGERVVAGMVDPAHRGQGLGARLLDWTVAASPDQPVTIVSEMVTAAARGLYGRFGFVSAQEERVMRRELLGEPVRCDLPRDVQMLPWSKQRASLFFDAYSAAFAERPGFPGWSEDEWVAWTTEDEDFHAGHSKVALDRRGRSIGFVTVGADWIVQLGVVPQARGQRLGEALVAEALAGIFASGYRACWLTVGTNNSTAHRLYERCGFVEVGLRGKYRKGMTMHVRRSSQPRW